ncbi:MAG TPA: CDP-archaeol synthase [Methyloceanibacter sp.]|nr:CDP-archaeol synthase [Methyloceanibacter sp.]
MLIFELLVLVAVANATPPVVKRVLGEAFAQPLDGGALFIDGRPLFGSSKTIRGIALSLVATPLAALVLGMGWKIGIVVAIAAMAGDLVSSFTKRRLGFPSSSRAIGLDHMPEALFPFIASRMLLPVTVIDMVVGTAIFFLGSLVVARALYKLHLRDEPY